LLHRWGGAGPCEFADLLSSVSYCSFGVAYRRCEVACPLQKLSIVGVKFHCRCYAVCAKLLFIVVKLPNDQMNLLTVDMMLPSAILKLPNTFAKLPTSAKPNIISMVK
jgi:hypothetical protein